MKKVIKISLFMMILMIFAITISYGFGVGDLTGNQTGTQSLVTAGNSVVKVITTVGIFASVILLIALGIKYMMGSIEEKAEYKKTMLPYVIGASLVFGASEIAQLIYNIATTITK